MHMFDFDVLSFLPFVSLILLSKTTLRAYFMFR